MLPLVHIIDASAFSPAPTDAPASVDGRALSATEASVWWLPLPQGTIDGYQVSGNICESHISDIKK